MKRVMALALAAMMGLSLAACGGGNTTTSESPSDTTSAEQSSEAPSEESTEAAASEAPSEAAQADSGEVKKMQMVTDTGGVNDESFNMLAWKGHEEAKAELGLDVAYIESSQESDYAPNLEIAYDNGAGFIWGIGYLMHDTVLAAAERNPETYYALIDSNFDDPIPENLIGITFKEQEPSFMVGYIAAKTSTTGTIGFVGGMESPVIERFESGYIAGAKTANKDINVLVNYVGDFNDSAKGKAITQKEMQDGADVIFHAAGASGNGVIEAVRETGNPADGGKWVIGVDVDQNHLAPDNVLVSACKTVDEAILILAREYSAGTLTGGRNMELGYAEDGVFVAVTGDHVAADVLTEVDAQIAKVKDGSLVIPGTRAEVETFVAALS